VVVTDGVCAGCGRPAPLAAYVALVRRHAGLLVLDDTQGLGLRGMPDTDMEYGRGGGGSLWAEEIGGPDIVVGSSLAKAFGAPLAVLTGDGPLMTRFERESEVRARCSPPSAAAIQAAASALSINAERGDALRDGLALRVGRFRDAAEDAGLRLMEGRFPFQRLTLPGAVDLRAAHRRLRDEGLRCVLQVSGCDRRTSLGFLITVAHGESDIDQAIERLARCARGDT